MKRKVFLIFALCTSAVFLSAPWSPEARAQAAWRPDKPLEIITSSAAGGSNDQIARVMQRIMQEGKLVPVAVTVMNKPGGNQTIAPTYLNMHAGDPNYLLLANPTLIGNHIAGLTPINYTDVGSLHWSTGSLTIYFSKANSTSASSPLKISMK